MIAPVTDPGILEGYLRDASNLAGHAEMLFRPRSAEEVAEVLGWCQVRAVPVTVTARRTSTTGAPDMRTSYTLEGDALPADIALRLLEDTVVNGVLSLEGYVAACVAKDEATISRVLAGGRRGALAPGPTISNLTLTLAGGEQVELADLRKWNLAGDYLDTFRRRLVDPGAKRVPPPAAQA